MTRTIIIGEGPTLPKEADLDAFWAEVVEAVPDLGDDHQVRSIGIDEETTGLILEFINARTKVATFSLPWVMDAEDQPITAPGTPIILTGYDGSPQAVIQITQTRETTFGEIGPEETGLDGPPVQNPEVWIPLHREYWNGLLSKYGKSCTDEMPIIVEPFDVVYFKET
ncbi:MAG: ASCH domain-containing protein [Rhodospirillaceae bacterium]|nr:ASCH domain-containing protein [Rhodospirillaceae bacterium]